MEISTNTAIALPGDKPEEYRKILARVGWVLIAAEGPKSGLRS
jgi:hypothetical protein